MTIPARPPTSPALDMNAQPFIEPPVGAEAHSVLPVADSYRKAGLSVLPVRRDGSKRPIGSWAQYQQRLATDDELRRWFGRSEPYGVAILCGALSGCLELLDFDLDAEANFPGWCALVESERPGLARRLNVVLTPGEDTEAGPRHGFHVRYRCPDLAPVPGNAKLAETEKRLDPVTGRWRRFTLIETRGEGGYALAPGTPAACHPTGRTYQHVAGPPLTQLAAVTRDERETLIRCAQAFNRYVRDRHHRHDRHDGDDGRDGVMPARPPCDSGAAYRLRSPGAAGDDLRPGDDFARRGPPWDALLGPHGWVADHRNGEVVYWRRPGKAIGHSATTGFLHGPDGTERFYCFSANGFPFEPQRAYSRFAVYAWLNHRGDFATAARELVRLGYGRRPGGAKGRRHSRYPRPGVVYRRGRILVTFDVEV